MWLDSGKYIDGNTLLFTARTEFGFIALVVANKELKQSSVQFVQLLFDTSRGR